MWGNKNNHIGTLGHILHTYCYHDDAIKWKHFPRYWPFVWGIHHSPVNSPHKSQWRRAFMFSGDLRRHHADYDVIVMCITRTSDGIIINGTLTTILIKAISPFLFLFCFAFLFCFRDSGQSICNISFENTLDLVLCYHSTDSGFYGMKGSPPFRLSLWLWCTKHIDPWIKYWYFLNIKYKIS